MRFLRISTPYREYLRKFYAENPGLADQSYAVQQRALLADDFQQVESYGFYLAQLGYEYEEIIANAEPLQKAWCREHGLFWAAKDFDWHTTLARALHFKPDVILLANARRFGKEWIDGLRSKCPGIRCVLGWWGVDIDSPRSLSGLDIVLTCNQALASEMRKMKARVEVLPYAFDPRVLDRIERRPSPAIPVSFVGSVRRADRFHARRAALLEQISERFPLQVYTHDRTPSAGKQLGTQVLFAMCQVLRRAHVGADFVKSLPLLGKAAEWRDCPVKPGGHRLWRGVAPAVYGLEYLQVLRSSRITLNIHPECAGAAAGNLRLFEATGVGCCLLTDWKQDLYEFFEVDDELMAFKSDAECVEKLEWLLSHEHARAQIAQAGQRRTLSQHSFRNLAQRLDAIVRNTF